MNFNNKCNRNNNSNNNNSCNYLQTWSSNNSKRLSVRLDSFRVSGFGSQFCSCISSLYPSHSLSHTLSPSLSLSLRVSLSQSLTHLLSSCLALSLNVILLTNFVIECNTTSDTCVRVYVQCVWVYVLCVRVRVCVCSVCTYDAWCIWHFKQSKHQNGCRKCWQAKPIKKKNTHTDTTHTQNTLMLHWSNA